MDLEGRDSITGDELAESLIEKIGGAENLAGAQSDAEPKETVEETPEEQTTDEAETTQDAEPEDVEYTEDAQGNLHGPDGKFIAKADRTDIEQEEQPDEETETPEGEEPAAESGDDYVELEIDDPEVLAYLEKYQGDVVKALSAATEAQKLIGRQGNRLGEQSKIEQEIAELKEMVAQVGARGPTADYGRLVENALDLEDDGQRSAALHQIADHAVAAGDFNSMAEVVAVWKDEDPFTAALYVNNLQNQFERDRAAAAAQTAQSGPSVGTGDDEVDAEVAKVIERHPDLEQYLPAIAKIADERPLLKAALEEGTPQSRAQALDDLYVLARSRDTDTSVAAVQKIRVKAFQDSEQAKARAAVVSGTRRSAASDQSTKTDAFKQAFRQRTGLEALDDVEVVGG